MSDESEARTWQEVFDARLAGLESVFGPSDSDMLQGALPFGFGFEIGGNPDILSFSEYPEGHVFTTAELVGTEDPPVNREGAYELAFAHPDDQDGDWGIAMISALAHSVIETPIDHGDFMDLRETTDDDAPFRGLVFRRIASFDFFGSTAHVIACIGITDEELAFCAERGSCLELLEQMPPDYIISDLTRASFLREGPPEPPLDPTAD